MLFCQRMEKHESIVLTGVERFSCYEGYARTFSWDGDFIDQTPRLDRTVLCNHVVCFSHTHTSKHQTNTSPPPFHCRDALGRRKTTVVAIDALVHRGLPRQLEKASLERELNKAYAGFSVGKTHPGRVRVASGQLSVHACACVCVCVLS